MTMEIIIGLAVAVLGAIAAAFGFGHASGTTKTEAKFQKQKTGEKAAATEAVAERRVEATKEASNVQQTVNHMPDDYLDRELRNTCRRPGGG
ncbi:hypothetical protein [Enterobacter roggenkampii]|uniref:hypothetical protein n=1 Tax=Enterobacter roggenkampii TaxID=1812935 RepID=UPI0005F0BDC4|nr:hypothetical protein [Enterobacter roggenkampii]KJO32332.1 hypothetical protein SS06_13140 [Enterobacter roggenkampii]HCR2172839.1 hypothetical protein [Enterobacter roggenkampii]